MKNSKLVALSAISCALALVFMTIGAFVEIFDLSCLFMASCCVMLPLSKKSVRAAVMTYLATGILAAVFFIAVRFEIVLMYAVFFGFHPIVNYFCREKKVNLAIAETVKTAWFVGTVLLVYTVSKSFLFDAEVLANEIFIKYAYLIISIGSALLFIVYDFIMIHFQKLVDNSIKRLKL